MRRGGPDRDPDGEASDRPAGHPGHRRDRRKWTNQPQPPQSPPQPPPRTDGSRTAATPSQPPRGARPYPSSDEQWHGRSAWQHGAPPRDPGEAPAYDPQYPGDYERYDTAGYDRPWRTAGEPPPRADEAGPPPPHRTVSEDQPSEVPRKPRRITVTRVAALRGRQLTGNAVDAFQRATKADGADKSGLTSLSYAVMLNYASDAAMAIALANTLFFAAASGESRGKVALYLLITIAPFALIAPVIGPMLDRIQRGRRLAMCATSAVQVLMCVIMALNFDAWLLYPAALGKMVMSRSFMVLKAAVTPRVVPPDITLSKTNARLTVFGLAAAGAFGAVAAGLSWLTGSAGALAFAALISAVGAVQAMRIPSWVEVTEGEVPASLSSHEQRRKSARHPMGRHVVVALWGSGAVRVLTGFLMLFAAFAVKAQTVGSGTGPFIQLLLLGIIGAAAGAGGFLGNALGSRLQFGRPDEVILGCVAATLGSTFVATVLPGLWTAAIVGLVGSAASALSKISLDAVIQQDMPEESRASAFGRSETVLQLSWCFGGAVGLLLPPVYWVGFLVVSILLAFGLAQTWVVRGGGSIIPKLGSNRPVRPQPTGATGPARDGTTRSAGTPPSPDSGTTAPSRHRPGEGSSPRN